MDHVGPGFPSYQARITMRTIDIIRRSMAGWPDDPIYPAEYVVFGSYYVGKNPDGTFYAGNVSNLPFPYFDGRITCGDYTGERLSKISPVGSSRYVAALARNNNPLHITGSVGGQAFDYNRISESGDYLDFFPQSAANGAVLRRHFGMSSSFQSGTISVHEVANDIYHFQPSIDISIEIFKQRIDARRSVIQLNSGVYSEVSGVDTGFRESNIGIRVNTNSSRIIIERIANNSGIWTWSVDPYDGSLEDGRYTRVSGAIVPITGNLLPTIEVATLDYDVFGYTGGLVVDGYHSRKAMTVSSSSVFVDKLIVANDGLTQMSDRDYSESDRDPIMSLYGGAFRIGSDCKVSINGGNWFVATNPNFFNQPIFVSLGDRLAVDASEYPDMIKSPGPPALIIPPP